MGSMYDEKLNLKSIPKILGCSFFIPSYQRGYRWGTRQVIDLLDDIMDFATKKDRGRLTPKEFYCLQPIVVKKEDNNGNIYRVIDGQQRLTTLLILLKYLEKKIEDDYYIENFYTISYETREECQHFIENINTIGEIDNNNIDFYYMSNTYLTIQKWFKDNKINKGDFLNVLLKQDIEDVSGKGIDNANNIRFIWYEIVDENEIDVFTRLNIGKIPLTNAELIKALFLINIENESDKILLASQWDSIEYQLQDDRFFGFIYKNIDTFSQPTRIEYIFNLIANNKSVAIENLSKKDDKYSYYIFNKLITDEKNTKELWDEVKTTFRIFEELYQNNLYYHLTGYLIHNDIEINVVKNSFLTQSKDEFLAFLKLKIKNTINTTKNTMKELTYKNKNEYQQITKILFLFNVISTLNSGYSRYPFDKHKREKWSLEHIHAQNSEDIKKEKDRRILLESEKEYVNEILKQEIEDLLEESTIDGEKFNKLQEKIFKEYSDDSDVHSIDNLALLNKEDNSSLNNSIFPAKRDKIKILDKKGSFIPLGTKNVFLKYYSDDVTEGVKWNSEDREAYLEAIYQELEEYLGEEND